MFVVIVEFDLHRRHVQAFRERVLRQAADSLELEPDCHVFDVCIDPDNETSVLLYEVYSDRSAFDAHLASAHFDAFDAAVKSWFSDKRAAFFERI